MCEPVSISIAVAALAAGGASNSIIGANGARQLAKGTENQKRLAQDDVIMENRRRATHDYLRQVELEQRTQLQETDAIHEQSQDIARQAVGAKGQAVASAAERGVDGNSVDTVLADYDFQQNQEVGRLRLNQDMKDQQHGENIAGAQDEYDYRVASVKPYVPRPQAPVDYFGPIFGALSSTASAAMGGGMKMPMGGGSPGGSPTNITPKDYGSLAI